MKKYLVSLIWWGIKIKRTDKNFDVTAFFYFNVEYSWNFKL